MKKTIFNINGGFPLTQDTLKYQQELAEDIVRMFYEKNMFNSVGNFIIAGCKANGLNVSAGWMMIDGEVLEFIAGTGQFVYIQEDTTAVTYEDTNINEPYVHRYAKIQTTANPYTYGIKDFIRLNQVSKVKHDTPGVVHLENRTYECDLPALTGVLELDPVDNTTSGFVINRINPFDTITDGYRLTVVCKDGSGLTFLEKDGVQSNLKFNRAEFNEDGVPVILPYFGAGLFIGSSSTTQAGAGYAVGLHISFQWSEVRDEWIEVNRSSISLDQSSL